MARRRADPGHKAIDGSQYQPASLDLRLGKEVYRVRASFLPGANRTVKEHLDSLNPERMSLTGEGAVLEKGIVYIAPLMERLELLPSLSGAGQPEELHRPARHLHASDCRSQRGIRRCAARLSWPTLCRNFAAQFQRARARRLAA